MALAAKQTVIAQKEDSVVVEVKKAEDLIDDVLMADLSFLMPWILLQVRI